MPNNRFLVNFSTDTTTERFSTGVGFQTASGETPSRAVFLPLLSDAGNINTFLFSDASLSGLSSSGVGKVVLNSVSGDLDYLEERGMGGRDIEIREEKGTAYPTNFPIRFSGSIDYVEFNSKNITLILNDKTGKFRDTAYQSEKYSGDNNGSSIELEGTADDIIGSPKPKLRGYAKNVSPVMVNEAKEIYQISSEPIDELNQVYVGRATSTTIDTVHTSLSSFLSDSVTAGQVNVYYGDYTATAGSNERGAYIMFGTTPSHAITVDVTEGWKNLCLYSEDFSNAAWNKSAALTYNDTTAPDGETTADASPSIASTSDYAYQTITVEASTQYTLSFYAKRKSGSGTQPYLAVYDESNTAFIDEDESYTVSPDEWTRIEHTFTTPSGCTSISIYPYRGRNATDLSIYVWGVQLEERNFRGPYVATTSAAVYNNTIPCIMWKILNELNYTLDDTSVTIANSQFNGAAQHWQNTDETTYGKVLDSLASSGLFYLINDLEGNFKTGRLKLPTSTENVLTLTNTLLLGGGKNAPRIKKIASRDNEKGIPIHNFNIGYDQNYTKMNREQLTGSADTIDELAYVEREFAYVNDGDSAVSTKFPNSSERTKVTKLQNKTDAETQATYEKTLFGTTTRREFIEVRVPIELALKSNGAIIDLDEVFKLNNKYYRVVGKKSRFPASGRRGVSTGAITLQGWGGIT